MKSITRIEVKLQETIKPNISNKTKNILGIDRVTACRPSKCQYTESTEVLQHICEI